jgi:hypothetical protein
MAATSETQIDGDGFTMEFSLDVVSDVEQDVEDVARQGVLGNFRKAREMFAQALNNHHDQFPVYAEYLRLCLDGGDWKALAEACDYGCGSWTQLACNIVRLLRAVGETSVQSCNDPYSEDSYACIKSVIKLERDLFGQLGLIMAFENFDNEEVNDSNLPIPSIDIQLIAK